MSGADLARARVRQLIDLTRRLADRLSAETQAFEERRPRDIADGLAATQELANLYRRDSSHVKADPSLLAEAPTWFSYDLPRRIATQSYKGRYRGQRQKWFALRFEGQDREIDVDKIDRPRGMNITVVTTATNDDEGRALLTQLGFPFADKDGKMKRA